MDKDDTRSPPPRRSRHDDSDHERSRERRRSRRDDPARPSERRRERETSEIRDSGRHRHRRSRSPRSPRSPKPRRRSRSKDDERKHRKGRDGDDKTRDSDGGRVRDGGSRRRSRDRGSHDSRRRRDRDDEDKGKRDKQVVRRSGPLPSQSDSFAVTNGEEPPKPKEQPNFGITGTLAAASNSIAQADGSTIVLKYHEPPEARKPPPKDTWKLFVFKGADIIDTIELSHRSCWLVGRELAVVDMIAEHPSISKQHAVIQFRYQEKRNEYGDKIGKVKPYLLDLESANGTMLNSKKVPDSRYLELKDKDLVQFGQSTREYVLMFERK
ncbi:Forkhead-associated (FHA) domain protein [Apiospora kogelbergensis]|uniref:Forkhead-associated (FHA) domain protein n=1 Tax=Apiospora kogelbergensis TaxID=1337665 RepID=A0AAW0QPB2_9PEZI